MRYFIFIVACIFISSNAFAVPCNTTDKTPHVVYKDGPAFLGKVFVDSFLDAMKGEEFKGYALQITNAQGEEVVRIEKGLARTSCDTDGEQYFTVDTNTPIASMAKVVTTAAVLHALENTPYGYTLDSKMVNFLPYHWRPELHPRFKDVTLRHLLQHRAGFRTDGCSGYSWREILKEGHIFPGCDAPPAVGTYEYSNRSMSIFNYVLAYLADPLGMNAVESSLGVMWLYEPLIFHTAAQYYEDYVKQHILNPIAVSATCLRDDYDGWGSNYTLGFLDQYTTEGEMPTYEMEWCPSGGWVMSTRDMTRVVHALQNTNTILSRTSYALMTEVNDYLGWRQTKRDSIPYIPMHGGAYLRSRAITAALPNGFSATWIGNTPWRNGLPGFKEGDPDATTFVLNAFHKARVAAIASTMHTVRQVANP